MYFHLLESFGFELVHVYSSQLLGLIICKPFQTFSLSLDASQDLVLNELVGGDRLLHHSHVWIALLVESLDEFCNLCWLFPLLLVVVGSNIEAQVSNDDRWSSGAGRCTVDVNLHLLFIDQIVESVCAFHDACDE